MGRGDPKSGTTWPGRKNGTSRPGRDVLVARWRSKSWTSGPSAPPARTYPLLNLLDLLFYKIKYFKVPKICILASGLQVTSKKNETVFCVWRENSRNHFNMVLAAPLQHSAESTGAFGHLPSAAETTNWSQMVAWLPLVSIDIVYFNGSVAIGHHWYK